MDRSEGQDVVVRLLNAAEAFTLHLRRGEGLDDGLRSELCEALKHCAEAWADCGQIPRWGASVLVGLDYTIDALSYRYEGEAAQEIQRAAAEVGSLAIEAVGTGGWLDPREPRSS